MPGAHLSVPSYISSRLELSAVWAISLADLVHRDICWQLAVGSFSRGFQRKRYFNFFPFLFFIYTLLMVQKIIGYF